MYKLGRTHVVADALSRLLNSIKLTSMHDVRQQTTTMFDNNISTNGDERTA
jgi:hypothetical protein